jgi:D-alanine-D-alanine ligase
VVDLVLLYNATSDVRLGNATDELPDFEDTLAPLASTLESLGHRVRTLGVTYENLDQLQTLNADFVLNLCEGTGLDGHPGVEVVSLLEQRGLNFSGAGSWCYFLSSGKWRSKIALSNARVPVPRGAVCPSPDVPLPSLLRYPLFVKPRDAYGSLGVDEGSVVHTPEEARARVAHIVDTYNTHALVEEYVEGREITVGLLGPSEAATVLPPLEVCFGSAYDGKPQIRMFATKHDADSLLYTDFHTVCPALLEPAIEARVKAVALQAYKAIGGEGYGRVDMRLARDGTPYVLEVNANCSLEDGPTPEDCGLFTLIGRAMGWDYAQLMAKIIEAGMMRRPHGRRAPLGLAWHKGERIARSMVSLRPGDRLDAFGPVYPGARQDAGSSTMRTTTARRVFVEPHVSHLAHSADPNLVVVRDGGSLWLEVTRELAMGDLLTIDRSIPLDVPAPARRRQARGWSIHIERAASHRAARPAVPQRSSTTQI